MQRILIALLIGLALPAQAGWFMSTHDPLAGSEWVVITIGDTAASKEVFLQFQSEGRVFGKTGVNSLMGSYTANDSHLKFGPLAMTMMAGPPEFMEQEHRFTQALEKVNRFERRRTHMSLFQDGEILMELRQRDAD